MQDITRIFDLVDLYRDKYRSVGNLFNIKREGKWVSYSAADYVELTNLFSLGLLSLGVKPGCRVATIMNNCPEWNFCDMGILQIGAVAVPIYPTISVDNYNYIFRDAEVEYLVVGDQVIYDRIKSVITDFPAIKAVFSIDEIENVKSWRELIKSGKSYSDHAHLENLKNNIKPRDLAMVIYTSGTTGRPKGVMLCHDNFVTNYKALAEIPPLKTGDRAISFLPLCHVYERTAGYVYQSFGCSVYYIQNVDAIAEYFKEVKPHGFAAVPRVFEKLYNKIVAKGRTQTLLSRIIFFWALRQGHKYELNHARGWFYDIKLYIANLLVFSKIRQNLGGELKFIVSGSASLHPRLTRLFWAAKIPILEAYGLTETSPGVCCYRFDPGGVKFGTVGPLLTGNQMMIAPDGEILVKGPNIMLGYLNRPDRTAEAIDAEGWFHTGDIGVIEEGKYLRITDRKKEIFKTSGGKYIAPQPIEQRFKESPFIEHVMVVGENRNFAAALIVPNFEYLRNWCAVKGIEYVSREWAVQNETIVKRIQREVDRFNQDLGKTEKIKRFRLVSDEWTPETGEISPTLKLRRKFIVEKYKEMINDTYESSIYHYYFDEF